MTARGLAITLAIGSACALVSAAPQTVYRARTDVVVIDAAVTDGRRSVTNLRREDFEVRDNGVLQALVDFDRESLPIDVTITIDVSGSMTRAKRTAVERAIAQVSDTLTPRDRGSVMSSRGRWRKSPRWHRRPSRQTCRAPARARRSTMRCSWRSSRRPLRIAATSASS